RYVNAFPAKPFPDDPGRLLAAPPCWECESHLMVSPCHHLGSCGAYINAYVIHASVILSVFFRAVPAGQQYRSLPGSTSLSTAAISRISIRSSSTHWRTLSRSSSLTRREIPQHLLALLGVGAMTAPTPSSFSSL